jgi:hypothetical protein|tara:strand:+ start:91 stop:288 length:198 start_codon:yes stop_codon:yes gene_type:complete
MKTEMKSSKPKFWDRIERTYEVTYPSGQTVRWEKYTISECLTKYNGHNAMYDHKLQIREIVEEVE